MMDAMSPGRSESWKWLSSNTTPVCCLIDFSCSIWSMPSTRTFPPSLRIILSMSLIVVVLPAPFSPMSPIMLPPGSEKLTSSSVKPLYCLRRCCTSSAFSIRYSSRYKSVNISESSPSVMPLLLAKSTACCRWPSARRSCSSRMISTLRPATKLPLPATRFDKAVALQILVSALGRDYTDAQFLGEQAHGGQRVALAQRAADDHVLDLRGDLLVDRALGSRC